MLPFRAGRSAEVTPYNCTGLTSVTIGNGVTSIGGSAFSGCTDLTSITVAEGNPVYHSSGNCLIKTASKTLIVGCQTSVIPTDGSVTIIGDNAFRNRSGPTSITIPDSVTSVGGSAFYNCTGLTSVTIGNGVTSIGGSAFSGCTDLTSITVAEGNPVYHSSGNCLIKTASKTLIVGCQTSVIPTDGSVTIIGDNAFRYNSWLTSLTIPVNVTNIGVCAFSGCSKLTSITYQGTKEQWNAIEKASFWDSSTNSFIVHCTDGDIPKS